MQYNFPPDADFDDFAPLGVSQDDGYKIRDFYVKELKRAKAMPKLPRETPDAAGFAYKSLLLEISVGELDDFQDLDADELGMILAWFRV